MHLRRVAPPPPGRRKEQCGPSPKGLTRGSRSRLTPCDTPKRPASSCSLGIASAGRHSAAARLASSSAIARRLAHGLDSGAGRQFVRHYTHDAEFRAEASRYLQEFESLVADVVPVPFRAIPSTQLAWVSRPAAARLTSS